MWGLAWSVACGQKCACEYDGGVFWYIYMFLERVSVLGICVVVLTCVLVLVCPCFRVAFFVVIKL